MYKRIRDSLFDPKKVVDYIKDKGIVCALFVLLFALIMIAPSIYSIINFNISYDTKSDYITSFKGEYIPYKIINGELVCVDNSYNKTYSKIVNGIEYTICELDEVKASYGVNVVFSKTKVYAVLGGLNIELFSYSDYEELNNFDFNTLTTGSGDSWENLFSVASFLYKDNMLVILFGNIIIGLFYSIMTLMIAVMIFSLSALFRLRNVIKFGAIVKMNIYYLAPFVFGNLLDDIIGTRFLYIVGIVITIIYVNIGQVEVFKRVYSHHTEG